VSVRRVRVGVKGRKGKIRESLTFCEYSCMGLDENTYEYFFLVEIIINRINELEN